MVEVQIMYCELCKKTHDGNYGSGRFCSPQCSRSFSTRYKRDEINKKTSATLCQKFACGEIKPTVGGFKKGFDVRRHKFSKEDKQKKLHALKEYYRNKELSTPFESMGIGKKRKLIIVSQNGKCDMCGISKWNNKCLTLQLDHIDGNRNNNIRKNLRALCPNCHSQTDTYCSKNKARFTRKISDEQLIGALKQSNGNIHKSLNLVGLNKRGHYRAKKLLDKIN